MTTIAQTRQSRTASAADDALPVLIRQARARPLLSATDEVRLARRIERGDLRAKDLMIESNLRLVFAVAAAYQGRGVPFPDLVQEGTIGLVRAVERFDHRRGLKLSTYAVWWIRRAMRAAVVSAQIIRVPERANRQLAAVRRAEDDLERAGRRSAPADAIAARTGLETRNVRSLRLVARVTTSLDEPIGEASMALRDLIADETAVDPSAGAIANDERHSVFAMLRLLPERHREVVERRYGIGRLGEQSHAEIGEWLGVGEERSRQLEREALRRLRAIATSSAARAA
jgi:RNA polymerase primary sigma factor